MKSKKFDIKKIRNISDKGCFICEKQIKPEDIIYEDKDFIAFLDSYPPTKGYTIIATKKHYEDISEVPLEEYQRLQTLIHKISLSIKKEFKPTRICLQNSGGFLKHFHFHVIPMYVPVLDNFIDVILKKNVIKFSSKERQIISNKIKRNI